MASWPPPNGPRLSCGRKRGGRLSARPPDGVGRRTSGILPYLGAPASSKRLLGGTLPTPASPRHALALRSQEGAYKLIVCLIVERHPEGRKQLAEYVEAHAVGHVASSGPEVRDVLVERDGDSIPNR